MAPHKAAKVVGDLLYYARAILKIPALLGPMAVPPLRVRAAVVVV